MNSRELEPLAVIVGSNHHNTLGLIRSLGVNGVKPYLVLINPKDDYNYCTKSRYLGGYKIVRNVVDALSILTNDFRDTDRKPVLFPTFDGAEYLIDTNYNKLSNYFILPGINNNQGNVAVLMNKASQANWAKDMGITMANTQIINLQLLPPPPHTHTTTNRDISWMLPCIVKPVLSHEGSKADIKKCDTNEELKKCLYQLQSKGYNQCLIQEFINYDCQYVIHGAILRNSDVIPHVLLQNIREWPTSGGTGTFRCFVNDNRIIDWANVLLNKIRECGYRGLFDIEFFYRKGEILLNEVNFRSSGVGYSMMHNQVYYPYYYYLDAIGESFEKNSLDYYRNHYVMNAMSDLNHVRHGNLSLFNWIRDLLRTKDFSVLFRQDLLPTVAYIHQFVKNRLR